MTQPINLNTARKAKARVDSKARADKNAVTFGRTKAQRMLEAAKTDKMRKALDAHRFEDDDA